jgi:hypothetical protein
MKLNNTTMSDKLKRFITEHKQEFDSVEPSNRVWEKIGSGMDKKDSYKISSKWLRRSIYLGFSASILVIAIYFITKSLTNSPGNELALDRKDSASNSERYSNASQNRPELPTGHTHNSTHELNDLTNKKNGGENSNSFNNRELDNRSISDSLQNMKGSSSDVSNNNDENSANSAKEGTENYLAAKNKKNSIYIPEDVIEVNSFTGTLYTGSYLCSIVDAYRCPGKVEKSGYTGARYKGNLGTGATLKTISCSRLEKVENIKAIWFKGKTDKKMTLTIKKGFKNIVLIKRDGRELNPDAISHYFTGLTVIGYIGRNLNLVFTDKVELLLFFKDAEAGDKIVIDGILEAVVKNTPY